MGHGPRKSSPEKDLLTQADHAGGQGYGVILAQRRIPPEALTPASERTGYPGWDSTF